MNPTLFKSALGALAASLVLACGPASASVAHHAGTSPASPPGAGSVLDAGGLRVDPLVLAGEGLEEQLPFSQYAVRPYPIENGGGALTRSWPTTELLQFAASDRIGRRAPSIDPLSAAQKVPLPEPGNWAMLLAGLLGVCAIARRRMSQ
jgi:hypothetical protein